MFISNLEIILVLFKLENKSKAWHTHAHLDMIDFTHLD